MAFILRMKKQNWCIIVWKEVIYKANNLRNEKNNNNNNKIWTTTVGAS